MKRNSVSESRRNQDCGSSSKSGKSRAIAKFPMVARAEHSRASTATVSIAPVMSKQLPSWSHQGQKSLRSFALCRLVGAPVQSGPVEQRFGDLLGRDVRAVIVPVAVGEAVGAACAIERLAQVDEL